MRTTHRALDDERLDVLPTLLEQRDEEVDRHREVGDELVLGEVDVADGDVQAEHLLELKLDGAAEIIDLLLDVFAVIDERREFAELVWRRAEQTRNLTQQRVGREESVVRLAERLDLLLLLLELLHRLDVEERHLLRLGFVAVRGVAEQQHREARLRRVWQLHRAGETLVFLRIVVLQTNLQFNSLCEFALVLFGIFKNSLLLLFLSLRKICESFFFFGCFC